MEHAYLDNKGRIIYKHEYDGSDYGSSSAKEYYKEGKLIYSASEHSRHSNLMGIGSYDKEESSMSGFETFYFSNGRKRIYETKMFDRGEIFYITEE